MTMNRPRHARSFEALGYSLQRFLPSDTRRIGSGGTVYKLYAAQDGQLIERFENEVDAGYWIEGKELLKA